MTCFHRRQRKTLAAMVVACWLFTLFVGVAHACGLDGDLGHTSPIEAMTKNGHADDGTPPACNQFCANDLPILAKIKLVQDQSSAQSLIISLLAVEPIITSGFPVASLFPSPDPPPGIAVNTHFVRLAL